MAYHRFVIFACVLAFAVILLGAYTRLADAGLGCPRLAGLLRAPDGPADRGARGRQVLPGAARARASKGGRRWCIAISPVPSACASWALRLVMAAPWCRPGPAGLAADAAARAGGVPGRARHGTVTLLKPIVVMGHLLGGFATFGLLVLLALRSAPRQPPMATTARWRTAAAADSDPGAADRAGWLDEFELRGAGLPGFSDLSGQLGARHGFRRGLRDGAGWA